MRKPLVYDGIVFSLQRAGGISVLFSEVISRLPKSSYDLFGFREEPPARLSDASYVYQPPRRLERYRRATFGEQADIFHSTYYRLPSKRGPKVVTTVFDFSYERFGSLPQKLSHTPQKRIALAASDRIICISESTRRDLLEFAGEKYSGRAVVVHLAAADTFHRIPGIPTLPQVLFVGSRGQYKNFGAVVDAVASIPELSLLTVGGKAYTDDERALLDARLAGRYRAAGFLSDAELNLEYNRSLCLAYPSLYEGFGIPVLEAMRAGCPVVAMNRSSIPEVAGDAAIMLERGDAEEISAAFRLLMVGVNRDALIDRGVARAARFSWDETYRQTLAVYAGLLGRPVV